METDLVKNKQIDKKLARLLSVSSSNIFYSGHIVDKKTALRSIKQHTYYLCSYANFKLLEWIFEKSNISDLNYILDHLEPNIFTDKLKLVLDLKIMGKTDNSLFIYHPECVRYILKIKRNQLLV